MSYQYGIAGQYVPDLPFIPELLTRASKETIAAAEEYREALNSYEEANDLLLTGTPLGIAKVLRDAEYKKAARHVTIPSVENGYLTPNEDLDAAIAARQAAVKWTRATAELFDIYARADAPLWTAIEEARHAAAAEAAKMREQADYLDYQADLLTVLGMRRPKADRTRLPLDPNALRRLNSGEIYANSVRTQRYNPPIQSDPFGRMTSGSQDAALPDAQPGFSEGRSAADQAAAGYDQR
jgi:hypothetical protein